MTKAYWLGLAGFVSLIIIFASGIAVQVMDEQQRNRPVYTEISMPKDGAPRTGTERIASALEDLAEAENSPNKEERERRDLDAQEGAWRWSKWAAWLGFWQLVLSGAGIFFVIRTLEQNREAIALSSDTLVTENRAWLDLLLELTPDHPIDWEDHDALRINIIQRSKNYGSSPALDVTYGCKMLFGYAIESEIQQIMEKRESMGVYPATVFPGEIDRPKFLSHSEIITNNIVQNGTMCIPKIIAYVTYRTIFDPPTALPRITLQVWEVVVERGRAVVKDECPIPWGRFTLRADTLHRGHVT